MKKKFSKKWKASKRPSKQKKFVANAPLHLKKKMVSVNLSRTLRKKIGKRNIPVKKNDVVKIARGKFKGKQGKVLEVKLKFGKIIVEGIQVTKMDNSKANVKLQPSNLQIVELAERGKKINSRTESETPKKAESNLNKESRKIKK